MHNNKNTNLGFNLVEVLVVSLIIAGSFIALAGSQLNNIRSTQNAFYQSQAGAISYGLLEKIRMNRGVIASYLTDSSSYTCPTSPPDPFCYVSTVVSEQCSAAELAASEIYVSICGISNSGLISEGVQQVLPNGALDVQCVASDGTYGTDCSENHVVITVRWNDQALLKSSASASRSLELFGAL
ncbi:MAG: Unknown protein [uncultured Thiotrichaceae bacterium]|uniref:Type IV pilin Tt1218-like domain-containing protein n=1 Tax=uncultured Thiotrichaceae bacterium TaxID=298394 RepID=A0A6S6SBT7_9GAMM|nr:MAG: Unknown protein [uncultured Thiotrichaceae bacterium]